MKAVRAFVAIGIAALWFALFAPPMFMTPPSVYTGVHLKLTGALYQPNIVTVDRGSPAYNAGIRTGDVLACMSSRDNSLLLSPSQYYTVGYRAGDAIHTCIVGHGAPRPVVFTARTGPPIANSYGSNSLSALRVCVVLIFFLTGIALVMARPSLMTWMFYAYCIGSAPSFAGGQVWTTLPSWEYAIAYELPNLGAGIAVALLLLFSILVPDMNLPEGWRRNAFFAFCCIAAADVCFQLYSFIDTDVSLAQSLGNTIDESLTALTVLTVLVRLFTMQRHERARFGWAAFAIISGVIFNDLRNVLSIGPLAPLSVAAADLTIVMPLALIYGILRRHVIDVRFVISKGVVYAALTTLVVGVIGIVDWLTSAYLREAKAAMAIDAAVTIALAFALHRTYRWIEAAVDFVLYRRKHSAETYLNRMAKTLLRAKREETVDHAVVQAPYEKFDLTMAALFRARGPVFVASSTAGWNTHETPALDPDEELVRFLATERTRLHVRDLRAHVSEHFAGHGAVPAFAIPLFQSDELVGFSLYGIHRDGTQLDPDEIETLEHVCEVAAQAYTGIELARYRASESKSIGGRETGLASPV